MERRILWSIHCIMCYLATVIEAPKPPTVTLADQSGSSINTVAINENDQTKEDLAVLTCVPDIITDLCHCNLKSGYPTSYPFDVYAYGSKWTISFVGNTPSVTDLSYAAQKTYMVTVTCMDSSGSSQKTDVTLEVDLIPNLQPVITGYPRGQRLLPTTRLNNGRHTARQSRLLLDWQ